MRLLFYVASNQLSSWSSILLVKHTVTQQVKKFPPLSTHLAQITEETRILAKMVMNKTLAILGYYTA